MTTSITTTEQMETQIQAPPYLLTSRLLILPSLILAFSLSIAHSARFEHIFLSQGVTRSTTIIIWTEPLIGGIRPSIMVGVPMLWNVLDTVSLLRKRGSVMDKKWGLVVDCLMAGSLLASLGIGFWVVDWLVRYGNGRGRQGGELFGMLVGANAFTLLGLLFTLGTIGINGVAIYEKRKGRKGDGEKVIEADTV